MATILIVDDLSANRRLLTTLLSGHGHQFVEAANGHAGLAAVQAGHPDLVITDVLMPVMDGYEFVRQLRLDPATSRIPVLFYAAPYAEPEARALALTQGGAYVLRKPAAPEEVLRIVNQVLSGEPTPASPLEPYREHLRLLTHRQAETSDDSRIATARLRALINIGLELAATHDTERLLEGVCVAAHDLFGASYVSLGIVDPGGTTVLRVATCGADTEWIKPGDAVPGFLAAVVAERRASRGVNPGGAPGELQLPELHPPIQTYLATPLTSPSKVYGWFCLVNDEGKAFTDDDEDLVVALSGQVGRIYSVEHEIDERRQAEEALRHERDLVAGAEREFRALFARNPLPMWIYDLDSLCFLEVNEAAVRHYGYAREEFLTMTIKDIRPHADEWRHRVKSGEIIDVDVTAHTITFAGKSAALAVVQDITDRKRAERSTLEHAQLAALGAAVGLALTGTDSLANALQQCADAAVKQLGMALVRIWTFDAADIVLDLQASAGLDTPPNAPHARVLLGESRLGRIARDRQPLVTNALVGDPQGGDETWVARDGIVAFAGYPLLVDGRVVGVMALYARAPLSDIVVAKLASVADHVALGIERHRGNEALRTAEERVRYALQSANVGIWDMDYATGAYLWSETLEAQYGLEPGGFEGTFEGFIARVHPDDRESVLATIGRALRLGSDFSVEHRTVWPDGTVRWLRGAGRVQLGEDGAPARAVGVSLDVTERHSLEAQYQQAQKMEAIGRLAGGVAHDFNNLLTAILGYCELLLADLDPGDPRQADIAEIHKAALSAAALTRQLLAFSRKQIIAPTLLDLNIVVANMRPLIERLIGEDVRVVLALRPGLATVKADRGQVEQIILNLAVNARDAMPGGGTLTLETANVELDADYPTTHLAVAPGSYVVLTVADNGTGMTAEVQSRLFEPFFTTKAVGMGTGLGLATVHGIVKQSGGSVNVYSEIGKGTLFKVYFPRSDVPDVVVEVPLPPPVRHTGAQRVLLVEDADGLRELTRRLLVRQGYTVLVAANADEAALLFEQNEIDLLLTDVVMPGGSGPELTRRLSEIRPGINVVYMSGYTEDAIVQHGVLNPGIAFLHKPFTSDTLGRKIREVLDRHAAGSPL